MPRAKARGYQGIGHDARIVDENIEASETIDDIGDGRLDGRGLGDVQKTTVNAAAFVLQDPGRRRPLGRVARSDHHRDPESGQLACDFKPQPAVGARHQGDTSLHGILLFSP